MYRHLKKLSEKYNNTNISDDSVIALSTYFISRHPYFKNIYNHLNILENSSHYAIFSPKLNNASGFNASFSNSFLMLPQYEYENENEKTDYFFEDYYDDYNFTKNISFFIDNKKEENIKLFFDLVEQSDCFRSFSENIKGKEDTIIDINQIFCEDFEQASYRDNSLKKFISILNDVLIVNIKINNSKIKNENINIDHFNARDLLGVSIAYSLASKESINDIINTINNSSSYNIIELLSFNDNILSEDIVEIIKNESKNNYDAVLLYQDSCKNNPILDILLSDKNEEDKTFEVYNLSYDNLKKNILDNKSKYLNKIKSIQKLEPELLNVVNKISNTFIEKNIPNENNYKVSIERYSIEDHIDSLHYYKGFEEINNNSDMNVIYDINQDLKIKGLSYLTRSHGKSYIDKNSICIKVKNNNEIVATSVFYKENGVLRVGIVNVADHHRGQGLSDLMYENIVNIAKKEKLIIQTTMHTNDGSKYLENKKKNIIKNHKSLLWLQTCSYSSDDIFDKVIPDINDSLIFIYKKEESTNKYEAFISSYKKITEKISNKIESYGDKIDKYFYFNFEEKNNFIEGFKKDFKENIFNLEKKQKIKNKKNNKK